ncbi:hypothetical protein B9Z19DRAFT_1089585 [Tuber borchii]|uniref:Uncharacterized protein n=1 Tax=Tuber borchii TaxID=42251 RepID=A0A2T6ZK57_TUBBO|nr:hypothetical protein B9Z19DRAFT_1089585 [Tuber borchii]
MWEIEKRRLARLRPSLAAQQRNGELMREDDENIWDNRDFGVVTFCERTSQPPFEETFRVGATPARNWALDFSGVGRLVEYFLAPATVDNSIPEHVLSALSRILTDKTAMTEFTPAEAEYLSVMQQVVTATTATEQDSLKSTLSKILSSTPNPPPATSITPHAWVYLRTANVILDLVAILRAHFTPHIKQKKLTNELSAALDGLKKATVASAAALAKEIRKEGGGKEHERVDGVLALEGVGRAEDVGG